jgi:hypothetical protein
MYTVTSLPLDSRTRVIFRRAELGFLGVIVRTCRQTPRLAGHRSRTGDFENFRFARRRRRTSWLIVGMQTALGLALSGRGKPLGTHQFTGPAAGVKGGWLF